MQITVIYLHSEIIQQVNKVHFFNSLLTANQNLHSAPCVLLQPLHPIMVLQALQTLVTSLSPLKRFFFFFKLKPRD